MNNNILLNHSDMRFEKHLLKNRELPFIIHPNVHRQTSFNIHENLELNFFLDGEGQILYNGMLLSVQKGNIVAVNSYTPHQMLTNGSMTHFCLIIDRGFCLYHSIDPNLLVLQPVIRDERASTLFHRVMDACSTPDTYQNTAIKCAVLELLLYLFRHYSTPKPEEQMAGDPALEYVRQAMGFMKSNLSRKLTADEIAACVGLSKFHFLREFKRITGQTMTHYLNTIRCEYARNLLESGQHSVKEVAYLCGFTNNSYFSSVFLKYTGLLPSQVPPL